MQYSTDGFRVDIQRRRQASVGRVDGDHSPVRGFHRMVYPSFSLAHAAYTPLRIGSGFDLGHSRGSSDGIAHRVDVRGV